MAGMLKKVAGRCRQIVKKECRLNFDGISVRRSYGSRARSHVKSVGLLTCYQIQQENRTGRSLIDCPELRRSCSREKRSCATLRRDVGDSYSSKLSSSYGHFHKAVMLSTDIEALSKHNCSSSESESDFIRSQSLHRTKRNLFGSHDIHDEAAVVDEARGNTGSLANHIGFGILNMNSRALLRSTGVDDVHLSLLSLANRFNHLNTHHTRKIKNGGIHARHYATRAHSRRPVKKQKNYYEELGITPHATQAQVKSAYINLSKIYHPDKNAGCKVSQSRFAAINEAYSVLGKLTLRKRYDRGTLSQKDIYSDVSKEEKAHEHHHPHHHAGTGSATNTSAGIPFSEEAKRHAKKMDDFFSEHYKNALEKGQRDKMERKQRMQEYMEMQEKAKISPLVLALLMLLSVTLAVKSVTSQSALDSKLKKGS